MADETTKKYRVKHGRNFFQNGVFVPGGETVELTDNQYNAFKDAVVHEGEPLPPPPPVEVEETDDEDNESEDVETSDTTETATDDPDDDDEDDDEADLTDLGDAPPEGSEDESPIVKRRREKAERKAAKKAAKK